MYSHVQETTEKMVRVSKFCHVQMSGYQDIIFSHHKIPARDQLSKKAKFT